MEGLIKKLYSLNRVIVGGDDAKALQVISKYLPINIYKIPSGTHCFTWTIPKDWEVNSAELIDSTTGKTILSYKDNPLYLFVGSLPFEGEVDFKELEKHLRYKCLFTKNRNAVPYVYKYYELDWGFCLSRNQFENINKSHKFRVSIKTSYKEGYLKIGEVVLNGIKKDEIIIVAHLDHPYQVNDNLSAVAVAMEIAKEISKRKLNFTIRILFLPETIGSIAYVWNRKKEISRIKAAIVLDVVGNKNRILVQKTFDRENKLNYLADKACKDLLLNYDLKNFRQIMGSDELIFNDPKFAIPAIMISTWPYEEYHTSLDTPDIIDDKTMTNIKDLVLKIIDNLDKDRIPRRKWSGPLMRSKIGWFLGEHLRDTQLELFGYKIDGKKSILEIAKELDMDVDSALNYADALHSKNLISYKE